MTANTVGNWLGLVFSQSGGPGWQNDAAGTFAQIRFKIRMQEWTMNFLPSVGLLLLAVFPFHVSEAQTNGEPGWEAAKAAIAACYQKELPVSQGRSPGHRRADLAFFTVGAAADDFQQRLEASPGKAVSLEFYEGATSRGLISAGATSFDLYNGNIAAGPRITIGQATGYVGIGTANPIVNLHVKGGGEALYIEAPLGEGRFGFLNPGETSARTVLYRGGAGESEDTIILRNFAAGKGHTTFKIWAPPGAVANDREATLALVRGDNDEESVDLYNIGNLGETQYGIRIQKRGSGVYRDFVFDQSDGFTNTPLMVLKADGKVGIGLSSPNEKLQVAGGNIYLSMPGAGMIFKSPDGSTCKKLSIDNAGNPVWTTVSPCP